MHVRTVLFCHMSACRTDAWAQQRRIILHPHQCLTKKQQKIEKLEYLYFLKKGCLSLVNSLNEIYRYKYIL